MPSSLPLLLLLLLLLLVPCCVCCVASQGGTVRTTTTRRPSSVTPTSTARTPTTTTTVDVCPACNLDNLEAVNPGQSGDYLPVLREELDASGCLQIVAVCTAPTDSPATPYYAFMEFNTNEGGPAENANAGAVVEALLQCRDNFWYYDNFNRLVRTVQCQEATTPIGG